MISIANLTLRRFLLCATESALVEKTALYRRVPVNKICGKFSCVSVRWFLSDLGTHPRQLIFKYYQGVRIRIRIFFNFNGNNNLLPFSN